MKKTKLLTGLVLALVVALPAAPAAPGPAPAAAVNKTDNVAFIKNFKYPSGTDLAFQGKYVYAGRQNGGGGDTGGGVGVYDVSGRVPKLVSFISCPGYQNDVAVVKPGLLALGYHSGYCKGTLPGAGVRLIDVSNPKKPKFLSDVSLPGGNHTLTVVPGTSIIYASPGGLANGGGTEQILDASNPKKLKVAATFRPNPAGCHDITFVRTPDNDRTLGFCAGGGEVSIWDVTKPLEPVIIAHGFTPSFFPHSAVATPDANYLVMTDEAFAIHDCVGGPTGSMWVFDISTPETPLLVGHWGPQRGASPVGGAATPWCTAHNLNFVPGTRKAVVSWYTGGTSVVDFENPTLPVEVAYYQPDDADSWSSYWFDGRIFINDLARGLDVISVKGLKAKKQ
ncbi:MAG: LVIVD repeat-containing protein [Actinomycetota bacterium]